MQRVGQGSDLEGIPRVDRGGKHKVHVGGESDERRIKGAGAESL